MRLVENEVSSVPRQTPFLFLGLRLCVLNKPLDRHELCEAMCMLEMGISGISLKPYPLPPSGSIQGFTVWPGWMPVCG